MSTQKEEILTFSVENTKGIPFRLRLARYQEIGTTVNNYIKKNLQNQHVEILDVGGDEGRILRHIEAHPHATNIRCDLIDLFPKGIERVYKKEQRHLYKADFETDGLKEIPEGTYDIVICEQVMEHLRNPEFLAAEMNRVLKVGGIAIIGVPSFPHGIHWLRKTVVPVWDTIFKKKIPRSHIQTFSLITFIKLLHATGKWRICQKRGFRMVSGGILRKLECYHWWWKFNRFLGSIFPCMCIEIQVVAVKI